MRFWLGLVLVELAGCGGAGEFDELQQAYTQQCPQQTLEGVDVYQGDGTIDWVQVAQSGRVFAFIKASQGNYNKQSTFNANWTNSKAAGLVRGAYHYFDATIAGKDQAQWFLAEIAQAGGLQPGDLRPALDLECPTSTVQTSAGNMCLGNGKNGWAPTATIIQETWDFLDTVEAATGVKPFIYTYPSWFATFGFTDPRLTDYPLWIASPSSPTCASVPAPYTAAAVWQYSSTTKVPGIGGGTANVDVDRFIGTSFDGLVIQGVDGGVLDAAPAPSDLATPDLEKPASPARVAQVRKLLVAPVEVESGCSCQVGRGDFNPGWWALLAVAAISLRHRVSWRRRRSS
jgi:lysozyme